MDFYILGLSPNSARLSVRFFLHNTFGGFLRNVQAHYDRLEIVRPAYDKFETLPLWKLLSETVNQNARDKSPAPDLAGEVLRAVLTNTRYPATLLNGVALRIRAEREVTRGRAAIVKAYYQKLAETTKHENPDIPEEVLQVSLNPDSIERALYAGPALFRAGSHSGLCKSRHQRHHQGQVFQLRCCHAGRDLPHSPQPGAEASEKAAQLQRRAGGLL